MERNRTQKREDGKGLSLRKLPSLRVEGEEEEPAKGTKAWPVRWGRPRVSVSRREGARRVTWVRGGLFY